MGAGLLAGARAPEAKHACIGDVRGVGLMIGLEFVKDRAHARAAAELRDRIVELAAFARGLLLLACGRKSSLRLAPPLVIDEEDVDIAASAILDQAIAGRASWSLSRLAGKVVSMRDAIAAHVRDGDMVVIEGFTHLICFAAAHEIIRQRRRDLTLCRLTPDLIYDQMIAAGCARKLVFSWAGNPGAGSLHAFRRAVEERQPAARDRGVLPLRHGGALLRRAPPACRSGRCATTRGPTCPAANPRIRTVDLSRTPAKRSPPCRPSIPT